MHLQTCYDGRYKRKICTWVLNGYFSATTLFLVGNAWHITRHFDLLYQHLHKTASKPDLYKRLCCGSLFLDKIQWIPVFVLGHPACHDSSTDRNRNPQPAERFRLPPIIVQRWFFFHTQSPCSNECGLHWYVNMTTCIVPEEITSCYIIVINLLQNLDTINLVTKSVLDENGDSYIHAETDVRSSNSCYILFASAVNSRWITCNRLADSIECYQIIDETIDWILLTGTYTSGFTIYHFMFFLALTRFHSQWGHHCQPA